MRYGGMFSIEPRGAHVCSLVFLALFAACTIESGQQVADTDGRATDPSLRAIMQGMDSAASEIAGGIWTEDYDRIQAAASAIADHPRIAPSDRQIIQGRLKDEFAAFVSLDQRVHDLAVELGRLAADSTAIGEVLVSFQRLQAGCIGCHSAFRQRVSAALATDRE